jgi:hypothetical protein
MIVSPFSVPHVIDPGLTKVLRHWQGLRRKDNPVPFADDLDVAKLPDIESRLFVLEIFERPLRARFGYVGAEVAAQYGEPLESQFLDEVPPKGPCRYLAAQWTATCEDEAPTYYAHASELSLKAPARGYARLLLPLWAQGYVSSILGAFAWAEPT